MPPALTRCQSPVVRSSSDRNTSFISISGSEVVYERLHVFLLIFDLEDVYFNGVFNRVSVSKPWNSDANTTRVSIGVTGFVISQSTQLKNSKTSTVHIYML